MRSEVLLEVARRRSRFLLGLGTLGVLGAIDLAAHG
jgi:hypothetical protein